MAWVLGRNFRTLNLDVGFTLVLCMLDHGVSNWLVLGTLELGMEAGQKPDRNLGMNLTGHDILKLGGEASISSLKPVGGASMRSSKSSRRHQHNIPEAQQ